MQTSDIHMPSTSNAAKLTALLLQRKNVNHLFHSLLTFMTFGVWLAVWIYVGVKARNYNYRIECAIEQVMREDGKYNAIP